MSQLRMEKNDLDNVPQIALPEGYLLRRFHSGDEAGLSRVYAASALGCETPGAVRERIVEHPCFRPERLLVITQGASIVGTACAWLDLSAPGVGYLHMLGTLAEHRGKRLGAALTVAAIAHTRNEGYLRQRLSTDDWREPAVRLYLDLGYYPLFCDDTHPGRWRTLARVLHRPDIIDRARDLR